MTLLFNYSIYTDSNCFEWCPYVSFTKVVAYCLHYLFIYSLDLAFPTLLCKIESIIITPESLLTMPRRACRLLSSQRWLFHSCSRVSCKTHTSICFLTQRIFKGNTELVKLVREFCVMNFTHTEIVNHFNHCMNPFGNYSACCI